MQVIAEALFWVLVLALAAVGVIISMVIWLVPALRPIANALRSGIIRAVPSALFLQVLSILPFGVLICATWGLQWVTRQLGADHATSLWLGLPFGLMALAIPAVATWAGGYIGFRVGWLRSRGEDPEVALSDDLVAECLDGLGFASPVRW